MTVAYDRGYSMGLRGYGANSCPYEGRNAGSIALMVDWLWGNFDGLTGRLRKGNGGRRIRSGVRSPYVRARLEAIRAEHQRSGPGMQLRGKSPGPKAPRSSASV